MHICLHREVPLKIWEFEPRRRLATTHVTFHKTFKRFWKLSLQKTASKQQQRTMKRFFMKHSSRTEISFQQPFLRAHIFLKPHCHEKELITVFKLPTWNAREAGGEQISNQGRMVNFLLSKLRPWIKLPLHVARKLNVCTDVSRHSGRWVPFYCNLALVTKYCSFSRTCQAHWTGQTTNDELLHKYASFIVPMGSKHSIPAVIPDSEAFVFKFGTYIAKNANGDIIRLERLRRSFWHLSAQL